jgi:general L-amino acid transport system permease protein
MQTFQVIAARPSPVRSRGALAWARQNLFASWGSTVFTVLFAGLLLWLLPQLVRWSLLDAVFARNTEACQAARGIGACWGVIGEKYRLIIFGRYPFDEQWRPLVATLALLTVLVISCIRHFWSRWLVLWWVAGISLYFGLMRGGWGGLSEVPTDQWGGLPLTIMLATFSIVCAFPLAVAVALGRRSTMPAIRSLCIVYIEVVRGVPLISVLFMASFMFPLLMPVGTTPDVLLRVLVGITLFAAAYLAEIVRGGLQAMPRGQYEAAATLGLSWWNTQRLVVLPQALATVVPGIMGNFIAIFKDTSLVTIVSLYELTGSLGLALNGDAEWRPFKIEGYLFITAIYFAFCFAMSRYSLWVETRLNQSKAR